MKRLLILLLIVSFPLIRHADAQVFNDVPPNHWAHQAVEKAARAGLITGFPDGGFHGNELLTRYQAAMILYRIMQYIDSHSEAVDPAWLASIESLTDSLLQEIEGVSGRLSSLEKTAARTTELESLKRDLAELERKLDDAIARITTDDISSITKTVEDLLAEYAVLRNQTDALSAALSRQDSAIKETSIRVDEAARAIQSLYDALSTVEKRTNNLDNRLSALEALITPLASKEFVEVSQYRNLSKSVREIDQRLTAIETKTNELEAAYDPELPRLRNLRVMAGGGFDAGASVPADLDRVGGLEGDSDPTTYDYSGPASSVYFGFQSSFTLKDGSLGLGFKTNSTFTATHNNELGGWIDYSNEDSLHLRIEVSPNAAEKISPYLLNGSYDYASRFSISTSILSFRAGYLINEDNTYAYTLLSYTGGAKAEAGAVLGPAATTAILYGKVGFVFLGANFLGVCHYPLPASDSAICYAQARLDSGGVRVFADYRHLGANATADAYFSTETGEQPYRTYQDGFGLEATAALAGFQVGAAYQNYSLAAVPYQHLEANLTLPLGQVFGITAYYQSTTESYRLVASAPAEDPGGVYRTVWGGYFSYTGPADSPSLAGLRLRAGAEFDRVTPDVYGFALASYDLVSEAGQLALGARWRGGVNWDYKFAIALASQPFPVPLGPAVEGRFAIANGATVGFENLAGASLRLTQLGVEGLEAKLRYGLYSGPASTGDGGAASYDRVLDPTVAGIYGGVAPASGSLWYAGFEVRFTGFRFSAGRYVGLPGEAYVLRFDYDHTF